MLQEESASSTAEGHILSRFDGDLGYFRSLVLDMGARVQSQVALASDALASCDVSKARKVIHDYRAIRDLDIEAQEANTRLFAIHKPVARDLRFVLTLSRAIYDLERINGEAVRLADIAEGLYPHLGLQGGHFCLQRKAGRFGVAEIAVDRHLLQARAPAPRRAYRRRTGRIP